MSSCRLPTTCMNVIGYKVCGLVIAVGTGVGGVGGWGRGPWAIYGTVSTKIALRYIYKMGQFPRKLPHG